MSETTTSITSTTQRRRPNILVGVTGSVAAIKAPELAVRLVEELDANVKVLLSKGGENFWSKAADYNPIHWKRLVQFTTTATAAAAAAAATATHAKTDEDCNGDSKDKRIQIHTADEEWQDWNHLGDAVLHIDLRNWADLLLLAPLSAHSLAKVATGLCDDTLSCVVRAWDFGYTSGCCCKGKPLVLAPAMNTAMWEHPLTRQQLETVCRFGGCTLDTNIAAAAAAGNSTLSNGDVPKTDSNKTAISTCNVVVVEPMSKTLACGEVGIGALASVDTILQVVKQALNHQQ